MIQVILILFNQKHNYFFQIVIIDIIISEENKLYSRQVCT